MGIWKRLKATWYSLPAELSKGALKGQLIRITDRNRYRKLRSIRPDRASLVDQKNQIISLVKGKLIANGISFVKVFGRVKTLGSLDRKERFVQAKHPDKAATLLREDLLGLTVVVKSKEECYSVLEILKKVGAFPKIDKRENPRVHFNDPAEWRKADFGVNEIITGNFSVEGFFPIHLMIITEEGLFKLRQRRGKYKRNIMKAIGE